MFSMICAGKMKQYATKPPFALVLNQSNDLVLLHSLSLKTTFCAWCLFTRTDIEIRHRASPRKTILICLLSVLAIVPIEYFNERNGSSGNINGSKTKSISEENRV